VSPPDLGGNPVDRWKQSRPDRRTVAIAGHTGDVETARRGLSDPDPAVRATALAALERLGELDDLGLASAFADPDPAVRRRAASIAARHPGVDLGPLLADAEPAVVEVAAWACGEHERVADGILAALVALVAGTGAGVDPLVRESVVAALGAIGDDRGLDAILAATTDRPAVRRRAVLALAPFVAPAHPRAAEVRAALDRALADRDWQVRQAAEDLMIEDEP
jgi:HEAT repeat protein